MQAVMLHPTVSHALPIRRSVPQTTKTPLPTVPTSVPMNIVHPLAQVHPLAHIAPINIQPRPLPSTSRSVRCGTAEMRRAYDATTSVTSATSLSTRCATTCAYKELDARVMMHLLPGSPPLLTSLSTPEGLRLAGHVSYALLFITLSIFVGLCSTDRKNANRNSKSVLKQSELINPTAPGAATTTTEHPDT